MHAKKRTADIFNQFNEKMKQQKKKIENNKMQKVNIKSILKFFFFYFWKQKSKKEKRKEKEILIFDMILIMIFVIT